MRTTVTMDDALVEAAIEYTGIRERSALVNAALKMMVEWEASRRLALMGGSQPDFVAGPRKRYFEPE